MKKRLHLALLLSLITFNTLLGQGTFPNPFDMSGGNTFTLFSVVHCGMPSCDPPTNIAVGEENTGTEGPFITPIPSDASYGTAPGNWYAEGADGLSYQSNASEIRGSILINLITINRQDIAVEWKVRDITTDANTNYVELQYRIGAVGNFIDLSGDLYESGNTPSGTVFNLTLPADTDNEALVQLRWIYYEIGSGTTDRLALDDVTISSSSSLPVELMRFDAYAQRNEVRLEWQTATETRNAQFVVERSADGRNFSALHTLAGAGDSREPLDYSATDAAPLRGQSFYRLKQVDFDGRFEYGPVRAVFMGSENVLRLLPTLADDALTASLPEPRSEDAAWAVFDLQGRLLRSGIWPAETSVLPLSVSDLLAGGYVFSVEGAAQRFFKK